MAKSLQEAIFLNTFFLCLFLPLPRAHSNPKGCQPCFIAISKVKPVTLPETPPPHTHTTCVKATAISQFETQLIVLPLFFCFFTHESTGSCWASQTDLKYAFLMPVTLESWDCRLGLLDLTLLRLIFNCYHRFRKEISLLRSNSAQFANKKK